MENMQGDNIANSSKGKAMVRLEERDKELHILLISNNRAAF